jgi:F0F1-type ATP synthase delta subunit
VPSRSHVATYAASNLATTNPADRDIIVNQMAAWLIDTKQQRQSKYLLDDIAWHLQQNGYVVASVKTARTLDETTRQKVIDYVKSQYDNDVAVELIENIDSSIIGGVIVTTPNGVFDVSVLQKLKKFSKGVI